MNRIKTALMAASLALGGCGSVAATGNMAGGGNGVAVPDTGPRGTRAPEVALGPEETMTGTFVTRFEHSDFNGCWLDLDAAYPDFRRRFPGRNEHSGRFGTFQMEIVGRRSIEDPDGPPVHGHMGGWPCEIKAVRIISASEIGHDRSAPDAGDTPTVAGTSGLSAGHDRARLDDIRRSIPPKP